MSGYYDPVSQVERYHHHLQKNTERRMINKKEKGAD